MVSMKDIAAACGVSVATVSKALNNHSDISDETKAVIKQKAREMGYHPNFSARALKTNKSYNIGVLYKDDAGSGLTHDYFAWILENFKVTAENNGYDITFLNNSRLRKDRMSYLEHSIYRGMDGVMIAIADYKNPEVIELLQGELPVVTIDYVYNGRISIMSDNVEGMQALLQYAYDKGHRRIAYIHGEESTAEYFANHVHETFGYDAVAPYSGDAYDLITNQKVADGSRKLVEKKAAYGMASREKTIFDRLVAAGQRLVSVIQKCQGMANKDLSKFADQINALCDKWDR